VLASALLLVGEASGQVPTSSTPEERAVRYLAQEVPRWARENHCYSCHNNGDGARALYAARQRGYSIPDEALAGTTAWLAAPQRWDTGPANPAFSDQRLTRIQFAAALLAAADAGQVTNRAALMQAAESLVPFQEADGSWMVDSGAMIGSPATYGPALATFLSTRVLEAAGATRFSESIGRARSWLLAQKPTSVLELAVSVMAISAGEFSRERLAHMLASAQNGDGGWGLRAGMPSEVFDTAVAVMALSRLPIAEVRDAVRSGRDFLISRQLPSGGWPETTRPSGGQSYAQHVSTSAWATLALLASNAERQ
jgi:squalene cyclase